MWIELTFLRGDKHVVNTDHVARVTKEAETGRAIVEFRSTSVAVQESYEEIKALLSGLNSGDGAGRGIHRNPPNLVMNAT